MVRLILILLLIVFIARTFWRVIDGVLDGMRKGAPPRRRGHREPAFRWRVIRSAARLSFRSGP